MTRAAVEEVLEKKRGPLLALLRRRLPPHLDPADAFQIGAMRAVERAAMLSDPRLAEPWVRRVLVRSAIDLARARVREEPRAELDDIPATDEPETDRCACSLALLRSLPAAYRDVLERVDIEEDALGDTARALGITRGNLSVRLLRARRALRRRLLDHCQVTTMRACLSCSCEDAAVP